MSSPKTFHIEIKGNTTYLHGSLEESSDLSLLGEAPRPLRLNLKKLTEVNSIGIRNLCVYFKTLDDDFIYEEVPPEYLDILNMVPILLRAGDEHKGEVESMLLPYECTSCDENHQILAKTADIEFEGDDAVYQTQECPTCGAEMDEAIPLSDLLFFMIEE